MPREAHFDRLTDVVKTSFAEQRNERQLHREIIEYIKGDFYPRMPGQAPGIETAINLISMTYRALARHTISKAPRVLVTPTRQDPSFKPWAEGNEQSVNKRITRSNIAFELAECARQSMASVGIFFIGPQYVGTNKGMKLDLAMKSIPREDYVHDTYSRTLGTSDIQGHIERMPVQDVRDNPLFDESAREKVDASGQEDDDTRLRNKLRGRQTELYEYADIWCVYERRREKLMYFPAEQRDLKLMEMDWKGPSEGPYNYLGYEWPPGHPLPTSPLQHLIRKHRSFNLLDMKAIHQQQKSKLLFAYTSASKEEAKTAMTSVDNEFVLQENGALRTLHIGGASPDTVAMGEKQKRDFSYAAGNLDQYLGLATQSPTLGQERLLAGASNQMLEDMGEYAALFVKQACSNIFWFDRRDPNPEPLVLKKSIPGTDWNYETFWSNEHRQFALEMEFECDVEPYSYVERSPSSRLADLLGALQIMMGMMDMMLAQGITIDCEAIVRHIAKLKNIPELYDVLILNQDPMELQQLLGGGGNKGGSSMDSGSPRRYIRTSESDGAGAEQEIMRMFGRGQAETQVA